MRHSELIGKEQERQRHEKRTVASFECVWALALVLLVACGSHTRGPNRLSVTVYEALEKAVAAFERADEYRDAGVLLYEPRFLDAEKAADAVRDAPGDQPADVSAALNAHSCVLALYTYRLSIEHFEHNNYPVSHPDAQYLREHAADAENVRKDGDQIDSCIKQAKTLLYGN